MLMGLIGGRDAMDRLAHADMARDSLLPAEIDPAHRETLERAGVVFGDPDERFPRLRRVVLPEGWRLVRADHPLYSNLLDEKGRPRAEVAYSKVDPTAWIRCLRRYRAGHVIDDPHDWRNEPLVPAILDCAGTALWRGLKVPKDGEQQRRAAWESDAPTDIQRATAIAEAKLDEVAPRWRDPSAYWDEEVEFPPHDTPPDARPTYSLRVEVYNGGRYVDGGEQSRTRAADDAEAARKFHGAVTRMLGSYDEVRYWIVDVATSRVACQDKIHRRREEFDEEFGYFGPGGPYTRRPRNGW